MTPQMIGTKHAAQGIITMVMLTVSFVLGAFYMIISAVTNHPTAFTIFAVAAYLLFMGAVIVGIVWS